MAEATPRTLLERLDAISKEGKKFMGSDVLFGSPGGKLKNQTGSAGLTLTDTERTELAILAKLKPPLEDDPTAAWAMDAAAAVAIARQKALAEGLDPFEEAVVASCGAATTALSTRWRATRDPAARA